MRLDKISAKHICYSQYTALNQLLNKNIMNYKFKLFGFVLFFSFLSNSLLSQWIRDEAYGFKINVPASWSQSFYMDGTDKVYDFYSPDENAAIQLRAFDATSQFTVDLLVQVYEESMLSQGTVRQSLSNHVSKQGIPGKQGIYTFNYNGTPVSMGVFFAIQNNKGYVISAMIPTSMLERKTAQVKQVTESFTLLTNKPKTGGGSLSGLTGGAMISGFKIRNIQISDRLDYNNNAVNPKTTFNTQTSEIHAVLNFSGQTNTDLIVDWVYINWNRTITSDKYNFTTNGGTGVVSLTKPNNGWPAGSYKILFKMDGKVIDSKTFEIKDSSGGYNGLSGSATGAGLAGKYSLLSRSDGKDLVNFHYIFLRNDGGMDVKYQPKNSGDYIGGGQGTWKKSGNNLTLHFDDGTIHNYTINRDRLIRKGSDGIVFTFIKAD